MAIEDLSRDLHSLLAYTDTEPLPTVDSLFISPEEGPHIPELDHSKIMWELTSLQLTPVWPPILHLKHNDNHSEEEMSMVLARKYFYETFSDFLYPDSLTIALSYDLWRSLPSTLLSFISKDAGVEQDELDDLIDRYRTAYLEKNVDVVRRCLDSFPPQARRHLNSFLRIKHQQRVEQALTQP